MVVILEDLHNGKLYPKKGSWYSFLLLLYQFNESEDMHYITRDKNFSSFSHLMWDVQNFVTVWSHSLNVIINIIIFLHGLGLLIYSDFEPLSSCTGVSTISSSSSFVVEGVYRESGVVHSFKVVDPVLFVFECHVLYSIDL